MCYFLHFLYCNTSNSSGKPLKLCINNRNSGLRFLFGFTLERNLNYRAIPRQKIVRKLPDIMTVQEIQTLFDSCDNLRDKAILMTTYGGGLRLSEVCHLRGQDIYASSMRIKICHGKGGKDRFTLLSQRNLDGKFLALLKEAFHNGVLTFHGQIQYLGFPSEFERYLNHVYQKDWVVYCKPPFKTAATVVEYLGRYTHRIAISNHRILTVKEGMVAFKWRDYKDNSKWKIMKITAIEFIRRFLTHVLPCGFMKIRHYICLEIVTKQ